MVNRGSAWLDGFWHLRQNKNPAVSPAQGVLGVSREFQFDDVDVNGSRWWAASVHKPSWESTSLRPAWTDRFADAYITIAVTRSNWEPTG